MAGHVRVTNLSGEGTQPEPHELTIRIDRADPVLGNKRVLKNKLDRIERARVIAAHKSEFAADVAANGPMSQAIEEIVDLVLKGEEVCLQCWCSPLPCHGDTYAAEILKRVEAKRSA